MKKLAASGLAASTIFIATTAFAMYTEEIYPPKTDVAAMRTEYEWPDGFLTLTKDNIIVEMWHPDFSGLPNDAFFVGYLPSSMDDINRIVVLFSKIKHPHLKIILKPEVDMAAPGAGQKRASMLLTVGSQKVVDRWFLTLPNGSFGTQVLTEPPQAEPPTLTICIDNGIVALDKLTIPDMVAVESGATKDQVKDPALKSTVEKIESFIAGRKAAAETRKN